jgi:soluble lytic murein transglycosylase-like protein
MKIACASLDDRTATRRRLGRGAATLAALLGCAAAGPADAQAQAPSPLAQARPAGGAIADSIAEASHRYGIPVDWIAAVMRAESAFDPRATSPKGAMGLMQLMPDTWAALREQLALGPDPYDPRDNILAGARYLRDLYDEFGVGGFLAAYNAGPRRYLDFLTRGRALPAETRAYVATISRAIDGAPAVVPPVRVAAAVASPRRSLFVAPAGPVNDAAKSAIGPPDETPTGAPGSLHPNASGLFVGGWGAAR